MYQAQPPYFRFYNKRSQILDNLHQFGEMAVVERHERRNMRGKLDNRGKPCIYVGRVPSHTSEVSKFFNIDTRRVNLSRNVIWLKKVYGDWFGLRTEEIHILKQPEDNSDPPTFIEPPDDAKIGERVLVKGFNGEPATENQIIKKKMLDVIFPDLKTNDDGVPSYKGVPLSTSSGPCKPSIPNAMVS